MSINPAATLAQAIAWVSARRDEGVTCPCCGQLAKTYKRKINSGMATSLIRMYLLARANSRTGDGSSPTNPMEWVHVPTQIGARSREEGKLAYWGLVEEQLTVRPDGGRAGWWRLTEKGVSFVEKRTPVRKYALVYNGRCLGHDGPFVSIESALGDKFDYSELMRS